MRRFADILIPMKLGSLSSDLLTYEIGESAELESLREGEGVAVEMGANATKFYTGIVWRIHTETPNYKVIRKITKRLYNIELLTTERRKFWEWIADYYLCSLNEVMRVALPSLIKPVAKDAEAFALAEYTPSMELYIGVVESDKMADKILKLRGKQKDAYQETINIDPSKRNSEGEVARRLIGCEMAPLRALESKGLVTITQRERESEQVGHIAFKLPELTPHQMEAKGIIEEGYKSRLSALLHGVTGSGKTEVYIHLIANELSRSRDVLMLVPEIALTTQLIERMRVIFGSRVTPYHSKISEKKQTETFLQLAQSREGGNFVVGARSSIFLPFNNLGLIVIDEEHDASYKQIDPSPRYNARDCAHILASLTGAHTLLGSATPSLESWTNASTGKFTLAQLTQRYSDAQLPRIIISDTRRASRRGERKGHFNRELLQKIEERIERGEQSMLLQNRRGFAPYVECTECGWVARCPHCNVSLTMHKSGQSLRCHYCDYSTPLPSRCPSCTVGEITPQGFGTEKIEEQLSEFVPSARTIRMDRDTANSPASLERLVGSFTRQESDVMVGTQMIAKGFDFSKVTLVGILNADNMLLNPDFRAEERAFALMTQVAGRAGRRSGVDAEVVIQTSQPNHRIMRYVGENGYEAMAHELLKEREEFFYPPYSRITMITLRHSDVRLLHRSAAALAQLLRARFGGRIRGPVPPPVDRIRGEWLVTFMVKIESGASSKRAREVIKEVEREWRECVEFKPIILSYNVDPQ
ncbi:MAG: primosomal protein N' [Rikenellaceae bacterium]